MARRKPQSTDVELQIAPMLDMAFQLLAFFVMTFHPPLAEGQIGVSLPFGRAPVTQSAHGPSDPNAVDVIEYTEQVWVKLFADQHGGVGKVVIGDSQMNGLDELAAKLRALAGTDEITLQADAELKYDALMHVVDLCTRAKITKINFADPLVAAS